MRTWAVVTAADRRCLALDLRGDRLGAGDQGAGVGVVLIGLLVGEELELGRRLALLFEELGDVTAEFLQ